MSSIKRKAPFSLVFLAALGLTAAGIYALKDRSSSPAGHETGKQETSKFPAPQQAADAPAGAAAGPEDLDSLAREVAAEVPREPNSAGHIIIASADTSDTARTDALLKSFARGGAHLAHMRRENAFVTRRQIVELPETFTQIGERIRSGDEVTTIAIPDFDGAFLEMEYDPTLMGPAGKRNGTLLGKIPGEEASDAILGYYEEATSGYVNLPSQGRVLEYMTVGGNQIVVKEIDLEARNIAEPCARCLQANGHSSHPAGHAHYLETRDSG